MACKPRLLQLQNVLVCRLVREKPRGGNRHAASLRIGAGVAFAVDVIQRLAVAADADRLRIPAGRDQSHDAMRRARGNRDHCDGVHAAVGDVERFFVGRKGKAVRRCAWEMRRSAQHAGWCGGANLFDHAIRRRVDHGDPIAVIGSDIEAGLGAD